MTIEMKTIKDLIGRYYFESLIFNGHWFKLRDKYDNILYDILNHIDEELVLERLIFIFDLLGKHFTKDEIKKKYDELYEDWENDTYYNFFNESEWLLELVENEFDADICDTQITESTFREFFLKFTTKIMEEGLLDSHINAHKINLHDYNLQDIVGTNFLINLILNKIEIDDVLEQNIKCCLDFLYPINFENIPDVKNVKYTFSKDDFDSNDTLLVILDKDNPNNEYFKEHIENRILNTFKSNDPYRKFYLYIYTTSIVMINTTIIPSTEHLENFLLKCKIGENEFEYSGKINKDIIKLYFKFIN